MGLADGIVHLSRATLLMKEAAEIRYIQFANTSP
jgi:hypothetical protein